MSLPTEDKPFKCTKCSQCFANSDRLSAHQQKLHGTPQKSLKVKIPGIVSEIVSDQTPTPTRFLKTADVEVSQLFEEINPFDQDFRLASKRQISTVSATSTTADEVENQQLLQFPKELKETSSVITTATVKSSNDEEDLASTESIPTEVALSELSAEQISQKTVSSTTPQLQQAIQQQQPQFQLESTKAAEDLAQANTYAILKLQEVLQEAKYSPLPQPVQPVEVTEAPVQLNQYTQSTPLTQSLSQLIQSTSLATSQVLSPTVQTTGTAKSQQDIIREQLQLLVNSGQIKIQFTSVPSSPKVQATIVGTVAKTVSSSDLVSKAARYQPIQPFRTSESIAPKTIVPPSMSIVSMPSGVLTSSNLSQVGGLPGTNLAVAKQKLKDVIIQQNNKGIENNNMISGGRVSMVSQSNQGKYKDIVLSDDIQLKIAAGETGATKKRKSDEVSPDEKRKRFLERNRAAASRCRQKRKIWVDQLEKKSEDLQRTNNQLITEIQALRTEVAQLKALLIAHKDCPVTLQQKALLGQIGGGSAEAYIAVSGGQIIAIEMPPTTANGVHPTSAEEVASSALTDMADRATIELAAGQSSNGTVTIRASDGSVSTIPSSLIGQ